MSDAILAALPNPHDLRLLMQSLAALETIVCADSRYRYWSFDAAWSEGEAMASMRNGSGDEWSALFCPAGVAIHGLAHESRTFEPGRPKPWVFGELPAAFHRAFLHEPAFDTGNSTWCVWRTAGSDRWCRGVRGRPVEPIDDGMHEQLEILTQEPASYVAFASECHEVELQVEDVGAVYRHVPMTRELAARLNPTMTADAFNTLVTELAAIGYPADSTATADAVTAGPSLDRFVGCVLGLATGDALGAPHEGGPLERLLWRAIGRTRDGSRRWTDDTQMAKDLAESLLEDDGVRPDSIAARFAASHRWSRGYGAGVARVLKRIRKGENWRTAATAVHAGGSYGNGAAMRAPVLALFFADDRDALVDAARATAKITHAHPVGIDGAVTIAVATHAMLGNSSPARVLDAVRAASSTAELGERLATVATWLEAGRTVTPRDAARQLGNGVTAATSCPTALYAALRHRHQSFEQLLEFVVACRGDVDTIAAMAGAMWGAANGARGLPQFALEARAELHQLAARLFARHRATSRSTRSAAT